MIKKSRKQLQKEMVKAKKPSDLELKRFAKEFEEAILKDEYYDLDNIEVSNLSDKTKVG